MTTRARGRASGAPGRAVDGRTGSRGEGSGSRPASGAADLQAAPSLLESGPLGRSLAIAAVVATALLLTAASFRRIWESDFWWQLATGRLVAASGPPATDIFSYTAAGQPWIELRWLYCLVLAATVRLGGYAAPVVLKWLVLCSAFGLAAAAAVTKRTAVAACAAVSLAVLVSSQRFFVRPELVTYLFFTLFVWILVRDRGDAGRDREESSALDHGAAKDDDGTPSGRAGRRGRMRLVYVLPILQVVWSNAHTTFLLGPALVAMMLAARLMEYAGARWSSRRSARPGAGRRSVPAARPASVKPAEPDVRSGPGGARAENPNLRGGEMDGGRPPSAAIEAGPARELDGARRGLLRIAIVLAATTAAVFLTPYGARGVVFSLKLFQEIHSPVFQAAAAEFKGPFAFSQTYTAVVFFEVLIGISVLAGLATIPRLDPFFTLVALSQLYLSVTSIRNLSLFGFAAIPFLLSCLRRSPLARLRAVARARPAVEAVTAAAVLVFGVTFSWAFATDRFNVWQGDTNQFGAGLATHRYPERAAAFLRDRMPEGTSVRLFNTMLEGSYLLAHGFQVFIDPRLEVHGEARLARFTRMAEDEGEWRAADREFGFQAAVVDILSPYVRHLVGTHEWNLVDFDDTAAVFARRGLPDAPAPIVSKEEFAAAVARARASLPPPTGAGSRSAFARLESPSPYLRLAIFLVQLGQADQAEPLIAEALKAWPRAQGAHSALAQIHEVRGEILDAIREYEAERAIAPEEPFVNRQLGLHYLKSGRRTEARAALERASSIAPDDALTWAALAKLHTEEKRLPDAVLCARRAVQAAPGTASYLVNLGRLLAVTGARGEAMSLLDHAVAIDASDASVLRDLAVLAYRGGEMDRALGYADRALALAPADPDLQVVRRTILEKASPSRSEAPAPARP